MTPKVLIEHYPVLFHMAHRDSWRSILEHGLHSTASLLDLFEVDGLERERLTSSRCQECVVLRHPKLGTAVIRDQKPMDDAALRTSLRGHMHPEEWYRLLNDKVFFWLTEERLDVLLGATAYRNDAHAVFVIDTAKLLEHHADKVMLASINTGSTKGELRPRGESTFKPIKEYPFEAELERLGSDAIVELTVPGQVDLIEECLVEIRLTKYREFSQVIWKPQ